MKFTKFIEIILVHFVNDSILMKMLSGSAIEIKQVEYREWNLILIFKIRDRKAKKTLVLVI